ncbi:protein GVQW3-like [Anastrepha ludens]|uniref:protein GVQW3-like n=1 Tax=Anastrepha ludens TaxID=28586 RepID=UPI0023B079E0|nr:protein GVQW3-like [Anastrepha ludens]
MSVKKISGIVDLKSGRYTYVCRNFFAGMFSSAATLKMLQKAYGECGLSKTLVYEWYKVFSEGREVVEDSPRSGRPSTSSTDEKVAKVKEMVLENHLLSLREVARDLNVSYKSIRNILHHQLGMGRVAA